MGVLGDLMRENIELCMIKNELRKEGLSTRGIFLQEFRDMSISDQKKWYNIKQKAKRRVDELEKIFPHAFGTFKREQYAREFINQFISR